MVADRGSVDRVRQARIGRLRAQLEIASKGMRKDATDDCLYLAAIPSLLPKWGGEPDDLERWVRQSMTLSEMTTGPIVFEIQMPSACAPYEIVGAIFSR